MPWIEMFGTTLNQTQKNEVATRLVETVCNVLKAPKEMAGVDFKPYQPENIYWQGGLLSEKKGEQMLHLNIYLPQITPEQKKELFRNLTNTLAKALNLPENAMHKVGIMLQEIPMENYAMGGRPVTEQLPLR